MTDPGLLSGIDTSFFALNLSGTALLGGIVGYAAKKLAKLVALLVGAQLAFLTALEHQGIISVDWAHIAGALESAPSSTGVLDTMNVALSTGILGAGFAGGFAVGFRQG